MSLGIVAIDHVQIAVPKALEAACLRFYREDLALSEIEKPEALKARGGAWFQVGTLQMHVGVDPEPSPKSKRHVCFLVGDLARARMQVLARGIAIEDEGRAEGLIRFFVRDPAGNRIEIGQRV
ncbi:MAG: VOC family protein [Alphaproteobacteria bacterium]|nr:VOC family protein [Alphaproteobacteria bacterium]MBV9694426.1 VOC family protein [Alphaproteobacteria bacterium]